MLEPRKKKKKKRRRRRRKKKKKKNKKKKKAWTLGHDTVNRKKMLGEEADIFVMLALVISRLTHSSDLRFDGK